MFYLCTDNKYSNIGLKSLFRFTLPIIQTGFMMQHRIPLIKTSICTQLHILKENAYK